MNASVTIIKHPQTDLNSLEAFRQRIIDLEERYPLHIYERALDRLDSAIEKVKK